MNEIRRKKLAELIEERFEGNQSTFALAIGKTPTQVNMWLSGARNMTRDSCENIEKKLRLHRGWMDDDVDSPPSAALNRLKIQVEDEIIVNQFDTGGAMGHGVLLRDQPGIIKQMVFNREWLGKNLKHYSNESNLCLVTGFGDSMRGMYNSGDPLIVDKGVTSVEFDGVYFFRVGDEGFIKRLQRVPGEGLIAISENKAYRDWTISEKMDFEVFGRVLRAWHSEDY